MNFDSVVKQESQVAPGVIFHVRRLSVIERAKRDFETADKMLDYDQLVAVFQSLPRPPKRETPEEFTEEDRKLELEIAKQYAKLVNFHYVHIVPAVIRAGLVKVEGLLVDGKEASADEVLAYADAALIDEIYVLCDAAAKLTNEQLKKLLSAGTSLGPATEPTDNTTAASAGQTDSTSPAIAASTSPLT